MNEVQDGLDDIRRAQSRPKQPNRRPTGRVAYTGNTEPARDPSREDRRRKWEARDDAVR